MLTHYTDAEIKQKLKELVVITDSREQVNDHLITWLDKNHIQHKSRALETGALECPEMPHAQTLRMMEQMDALRAGWGIRYPFE